MQPCQVRAAVVGLQNGLVQTVTVQEMSLLARCTNPHWLLAKLAHHQQFHAGTLHQVHCDNSIRRADKPIGKLV